MILPRPNANAKLLLHEEKAEYGYEISDSVQESEDFMLVSQEIQASISLKHSVSYLSLLPKMCVGGNSFKRAAQNAEFIMEGFHLSKNGYFRLF